MGGLTRFCFLLPQVRPPGLVIYSHLWGYVREPRACGKSRVLTCVSGSLQWRFPVCSACSLCESGGAALCGWEGCCFSTHHSHLWFIYLLVHIFCRGPNVLWLQRPEKVKVNNTIWRLRTVVFFFFFFASSAFHFLTHSLFPVLGWLEKGLLNAGEVGWWRAAEDIILPAQWKTSRLQGTPVGTFGKVLWK